VTTRRGPSVGEQVGAWLARPEIIERLALLRILAPLAALGFMSSRLIHADHWIGSAGFSVPNLGGDYRQPIYLAPLPDELAWLLAAVMVVSGLATAVGFRTRPSAAVFAGTLVYVALADRLAAFTVSKISPVIMVALALSAAGARFGVDAWLNSRREGEPSQSPTHAPGGAIRFVQLFLPIFYCSSGICKGRGDWFSRWDVLWTHLHDSYQTPVSFFLAENLPAGSWALMQLATIVFEIGAPLWFALASTRSVALLYALAMHALIGLMFGPVIWFSLLMMILNVTAFAPEKWVKAPFDFLRERFGAGELSAKAAS
jgi:uncharacterized membrane protein YphA (DoxX/SURF4 family)